MSRFVNQRVGALTPYVPGEQPQDRSYIKLNTNESPFPPSEAVAAAVAGEVDRLQLYSDPDCRALHRAAADYYGLEPEQILMTNGSDEILNFAFMAFGGPDRPFAFPTVTYGFYPVFAALNGVPCRQIPLTADLRVDPADYRGLGCNVVLANPNAPTGLAVTVDDVAAIAAANPNHVVVVDEAYIDFGGQTCLPLLAQYDNLLITRTFSKSFSLAGARLGFGMGHPDLIRDLNTVKFSTNPYNVNRMTMAAGQAALATADYYMDHCRQVAATRETTKAALREMGFTVTDSLANFLFAAHPAVGGAALYEQLKQRGILVRHFAQPAIENYNRITVGTNAQMQALLAALADILQGV